MWSSLWTFRGVDEREFHRIDHLAASKAVLVHESFDDERANGVAVTRNPFDPNWPGFYVNVQVGESLVTNPQEGATPDELLISAIGPRGEYETQYIRRSSIAPGAAPVLTQAEIRQLIDALETIRDHFGRLHGADGDPAFAMDVEFKVAHAGRLVVKQARPWVE